MQTSWRLIRSGPLSGALNMALDEALLEAVAGGRSRPLLRLYRWSPPAVTLGYAQPATEVNAAACRELGFDLVRRPTGGRAVLHDREATYAVIAPARFPAFAGPLLETYGVIARALRRAVADLGIPAEPVPGRRRAVPGEGGAICFTAPSSRELVFRGCKIAGSAQKRIGGAFLQHGSIPVEMDLDQLCRLIDPGRKGGRAGDPAKLAQSVGWLNRWLDRPIAVEMVEAALVAAFERELALHFLPEEPTSLEWDRARQLVAEKYGKTDWTFNPVTGSRFEVKTQSLGRIGYVD